MSKKNALDALESTRDLHQAAWAKLGKVIARKKFLGKPYAHDQRLRTRASQRIATYNSRLLEVQAASSVIAAPSTSEVAKVRQLLRDVKDIAVADAALRAGFARIKSALSSSADIASQVKTG